MPLYPYHIAPERHAPFPSVAELPTIEADSVQAAVAKLAHEGRLPSEVGVQFWVRFATGTENGKIQVASVPITPEATVECRWDAPAPERGGDGL
jgi:hypothetical protein